mmetsp:Transcript_8257/g.28973  ORF Transcript_8257/g.28973 Transcript_8257/m.28973 type:complete len:283 (+) Transcript_8257:1714-2562(+)
MVVRAQELRHCAPVLQVRRPLDANAERHHALALLEVLQHALLQLQSVLQRRLHAAIEATLGQQRLHLRHLPLHLRLSLLHCAGRPVAVLRLLHVPHGDACDEARVQAAGEQHAEGHVGHEAVHDGVHDRLAQVRQVQGRVRHILLVSRPPGVVPPPDGARVALAARVHVTRREYLVALDALLAGEPLHLGGEPHGAVIAVTDVQRDLAHVVAGGDDGPGRLVLQREREHAVQLVDEVHAEFLVEVADDCAVAVVVVALDAVLLAQLGVVVDLAVRDVHGVPG